MTLLGAGGQQDTGHRAPLAFPSRAAQESMRAIGATYAEAPASHGLFVTLAPTARYTRLSVKVPWIKSATGAPCTEITSP